MPKIEKDEIPTSPTKAKSASGIINVVSKKSIRTKNARKKEVSDSEYYSSNSEEEEVSESEEETEEDSEEQDEETEEDTEESDDEESEDNNKNKNILKKNIKKTIKAFNEDTKKRNMRKLSKPPAMSRSRGGYDEKQFNKILQKMFPSKYIKKKSTRIKK